MNTDKQQIADDLRGGAQYIRKHGHAQGTMETAKGEVCAMGGIRGHCGTLHESWGDRDRAPVRALAEYLGLEIQPHWTDWNILDRTTKWVADWNDGWAEDAEEVVTTMEKLAAQIEERA